MGWQQDFVQQEVEVAARVVLQVQAEMARCCFGSLLPIHSVGFRSMLGCLGLAIPVVGWQRSRDGWVRVEAIGSVPLLV